MKGHGKLSLVYLFSSISIVLIVFGGWYYPAFFKPLFHADDITIFWHHLNWGAWVSTGGWVGNGRFLQWLIHASAMEWVSSLEDFVIFRWIGLLFSLFFGFIFLRCSHGIQPLKATILLFFLFISPSFAVYFTQTHFIDILLAGGFSMLSGLSFIRYYETRSRILWYAFTGLSYAWISLHLHQAAIGFFWIPFLLELTDENKSTALNTQRIYLWMYHAFIYLFICGIYWVYFNLLMNWLEPGSMLTRRGGIPANLYDRPLIFFKDYLYTSLVGFQHFPKQGIPLITCFITLALCALSWKWLFVQNTPGIKGVLSWIALPLTLMLSVAPALASQDLFFAYRLSGPLSACIIIVILGGAVLAPSLQSKLRRRAIMGAFILWAVLFFLPSKWAIQTGLIEAQSDEYAKLRTLVQEERLHLISQKWTILRPVSNRFHSGMMGKAEYGLHNTWEHFAIINYFQILVEHYGPWTGHWMEFTIIDPGEAWPIYPYPIISMDHLLDSKVPNGQYLHNSNALNMSGIGTVYKIGKETYYSPWLGYLDYTDQNTWKHERLGEFWVMESDAHGLQVNSKAFGQLWIHPPSFPMVKPIEQDQWIRIPQ